MKQTFTPQDIIRFIYQEMTPEEEVQMKLWLAGNPAAAEEVLSLSGIVSELSAIRMDPSETSVNLIMEYARESVEEEHHA